MLHSHAVHLALGALLSPCTMCGTGALMELASGRSGPPKVKVVCVRGNPASRAAINAVAEATQYLLWTQDAAQNAAAVMQARARGRIARGRHRQAQGLAVPGQDRAAEYRLTPRVPGLSGGLLSLADTPR